MEPLIYINNNNASFYELFDLILPVVWCKVNTSDGLHPRHAPYCASQIPGGILMHACTMRDISNMHAHYASPKFVWGSPRRNYTYTLLACVRQRKPSGLAEEKDQSRVNVLNIHTYACVCVWVFFSHVFGLMRVSRLEGGGSRNTERHAHEDTCTRVHTHYTHA